MKSLSEQSEPNRGTLPVGRVHGHRGRDGEITIRTAGEAQRWLDSESVLIDRGRGEESFEIESQRAYRDRWVVKLKGIEDANEAAGLRGGKVEVPRIEAPTLGEHEHWHVDLIGMAVRLPTGETVGRVSGVQPSPGSDLLVVESVSGDAEWLIPMHREIVVEVNEEDRFLSIDPPDGLLELNE